MVRTIYWYFKFVTTLFLNYPKLKKAEGYLKKGEIEKFEKLCFEETAKWALNRIKDSRAKINVFGEENIPYDENVLFISNHQGDFDIAIFMSMIPKNKGFVAKMELCKLPILSKWIKYMNCVFMDRKNIRQSVEAINQAIEFLKSGKSMVIFPEGTRSKSGKIGKFKAGSFKLATKTNVTIVPVTIDGTYKLKEKNKGLIKPDIVNVYIHKPIITRELSEKEKDKLPESLRNIIKSKLSEGN